MKSCDLCLLGVIYLNEPGFESWWEAPCIYWGFLIESMICLHFRAKTVMLIHLHEVHIFIDGSASQCVRMALEADGRVGERRHGLLMADQATPQLYSIPWMGGPSSIQAISCWWTVGQLLIFLLLQSSSVTATVGTYTRCVEKMAKTQKTTCHEVKSALNL